MNAVKAHRDNVKKPQNREPKTLLLQPVLLEEPKIQEVENWRKNAFNILFLQTMKILGKTHYKFSDFIDKLKPASGYDFVIGINCLNNVLSNYKLSGLSGYPKIIQWKSEPEYPDVFSIQDYLDYTLLPFVLQHKLSQKPFLTPSFLSALTYETRTGGHRKQVAMDAIRHTLDAIPELYRELKKLELETYSVNKLLIEIHQDTFSSKVSKRFIDTYFELGLPIYSGIGFSILSTEDVITFCQQGATRKISFRSFTIDLRVAIHFSGRVKLNDSGKIEPDSDNKVIFISFLEGEDKIPFVSDKDKTWEAEILISIADYEYQDHFTILHNRVTYKFIVVKIIRSENIDGLITDLATQTTELVEDILRIPIPIGESGEVAPLGVAVTQNYDDSDGGKKRKTYKRKNKRTRNRKRRTKKNKK